MYYLGKHIMDLLLFLNESINGFNFSDLTSIVVNISSYNHTNKSSLGFSVMFKSMKAFLTSKSLRSTDLICNPVGVF